MGGSGVWRGRVIGTAQVVCAILGGCALEPYVTDGADTARRHVTAVRSARERDLQSTWIGKERRDLAPEFGTAAMVLGVPGEGRLPLSYIVVFKDQDARGKCIDAFVVFDDGTEKIWNYFCR